MFCITYHKESARSIGCRSDTLTTHTSIDINNHSYYNIILKRFYYILITLVDQWVSSISIGSMKEFRVGTKIVHSISMGKLVWVWKGVNL